MENNTGKTSSGLDANVAAALSYLLGWVTGLVFFLIEKDNKFVRFHAMQSIIVFGGLTIINIVFSFFVSSLGLYGMYSIGRIIEFLAIALWIVLMVKAFQGDKFKLPVVGDIAEKNS